MGMAYWPVIKVYYDESGHLIIVYAPAYSTPFQSGGDIEELEIIAEEMRDGD